MRTIHRISISMDGGTHAHCKISSRVSMLLNLLYEIGKLWGTITVIIIFYDFIWKLKDDLLLEIKFCFFLYFNC